MCADNLLSQVLLGGASQNQPTNQNKTFRITFCLRSLSHVMDLLFFGAIMKYLVENKISSFECYKKRRKQDASRECVQSAPACCLLLLHAQKTSLMTQWQLLSWAIQLPSSLCPMKRCDFLSAAPTICVLGSAGRRTFPGSWRRL